MKPKQGRQYWKIVGREGFETLFEHKIYVGQITENQLRNLLQVLFAKLALTEGEIIKSYAKKGTKAHSSHIDKVQKLDGKKFMYSCGTNPYVTATAEYEPVL
ncbi:hypothetical protein [Aliidiomarina soli]|uniref:Uncharacterized protein n=1 Tax=Aliidiomarina soli TaxID=1928574 RepID=A0A432WC53_9GAMM|nr:hypothetical protein [Aliidiomarina soli]RUO29549.1 hypothetical protein CWE14_13890 [Aliidiomarina soli]